ncbi:MAG: hypothetical protein ABIZ56_00250 [Chthoniobacteraceae bacterium]
MITRISLLIAVGMCAACSRKETPPAVETAPLVAQPSTPPPPVQLGPAPRMKEE